MAYGQLKINGIDAFVTYGMSLSDGGVSALMTPAPNKAYISNKSRLENGSRVINNNPKVDERTVTLPFHIIAPTKEIFFQRYEALCNVLAEGEIEIWSCYYPEKLFRMKYQSCTQFSEYSRQMAKFSLKLIEPDPTNRSL